MINIKNDNIKHVGEESVNESNDKDYQYTPKPDFQMKLIITHKNVGKYRVSWNGNNMPVKEFIYRDGHIGSPEPITIDWDRERYPYGILGVIEKVKFKDNKGQWNTLYIFEGEKYTTEEFIKKINRERDSKWFRFAIELMESREVDMRPLAIYEDGNHFTFPDPNNIITDSNNKIQELLKDNLHIGDLNEDLINEGILLLTNKQKIVYYTIPAVVLANILGLEDYKRIIDLIGASDTGKSFVVNMALHHWFGISPNFKLKSDAVNSLFRSQLIQSATNLPIYIEEATISNKIMRSLKSAGNGIRGKQNLSFDIYSSEATFILSRNSRETDENFDEQDALANKRVLSYFFDENDKISDVDKDKGKMYIHKLKGANGGLLYEKLREVSKESLEDHYWLSDKMFPDKREFLLHYGAWLIGADINSLKTDFGEEQEEEILIGILQWLDSFTHEDRKGQRIQSLTQLDGDLLKLSKELIDMYFGEHRNIPYKSFNNFAKGQAKKYPNVVKYHQTSVNKLSKTYTLIINLDSFISEIGEDWRTKFKGILYLLTNN